MKRKALFNLLFLLFLIVGTVYILMRREATLRTVTGPIYGTSYTISYEHSEPLDSLILFELKRVDASLSMFNPQSLVSRINKNQINTADSLFIEVFRLSQSVSQATNGAYDVTVAPLVNLWGFGFKNEESVTQKSIDSLRQVVGYNKVHLTGNVLVKADSRMMLDFSSVAKGYGVDRVAHLLDCLGVKNYMIEVGGEVRVAGCHPEGRPWRIAISKPEENAEKGEKSIQGTLELHAGAMATSGNYRRFYYKDGRRYAHTINPATGLPVRHSLLSATVIAPTCAMADAYATAFMVMGEEGARKVLSEHPELAAYFILADSVHHYRVWQTENFPPVQ